MREPATTVGDVVEWDNTDSVPHTSTSGATPNPDGIWDTGLLNPGESACVQYNQAGTYDYYCTVHPVQMTGVLTVQ